MLQQLVLLFLIGLGVRTPVLPGTVLGDQADNRPAAVMVNPGTLRSDTTEIQTDTKQIRTDRQTFRADMASGNKASAGGDLRNLRGDIKDRRLDIKNFANDLHEKEASNESRERDELFALHKAVWDKFRDEIQSERASASAAFKKERDAFKARLVNIKNTAKQSTLQNLDTLISQINTKRTATMTDHLTSMDQILTKITAALSTLSSGGVNVSEAQNAVDAANTAISSAKAAVAAQAGKEYVIGITSEPNLGNDVGRTKSQLTSDLQAVEATITRARQAVAAAINAYAKLKGEATQAQ